MKKSVLALGLITGLLTAFIAPSFAADPAPVEKEWSILVFLNGDNNLDPYGSADMKEMEMIGSSAQVNIVVLRDTSKAENSTKMFYVEKGRSRVVKDFGANIDMGDWKRLVEFFEYAKTHFPAKRYLVDIWNHGSGWKRRSPLDPTRGISYDDHSGNHISTPQLGEALRAMRKLNGDRKIDILGLDACLMEMAEVIYEVADGANVVAGSEQTEPADGWAYQGFLRELVGQPQMEAEELATLIEREYVKSYNGGTQGTKSAQGSAVSTERLVAAKDAFNTFAAYALLTAPANRKTLLSVMKATQSYYYPEYKDLIHFLTLARNAVQDPQWKALADDAIEGFRASVVANFVTGTGLDNSHGAAVWMPIDRQYAELKAKYAELRWTRETEWESFLESILYPSTPVVSIADIVIEEERPDGFISRGEKLRFKVTLKNDSPVAGRNVSLALTFPAGIAAETSLVTVNELKQGDTVVSGLLGSVDWTTEPGNYPLNLTVSVPGFAELKRDFAVAVDPDYTVEEHQLASPHPYPNSHEESWTISKTGVAGMRVHFSRITTEAKYDFVSIHDQTGRMVAKYDGSLGAFWAPYVPGDTVTIRLTSDSGVTNFGFEVDKIAY